MKDIRIIFGLWLLLTTAPLYAEPITLTFSTLTTHSASKAGVTVSFLNGRASLPSQATTVHSLVSAGITREALTLDLTQTTDILSFDRAFHSRHDLAMGHTPLALKPATFTFENLSLSSLTIPEPAALVLLGTGLAALAALTKKRKNK